MELWNPGKHLTEMCGKGVKPKLAKKGRLGEIFWRYLDIRFPSGMFLFLNYVMYTGSKHSETCEPHLCFSHSCLYLWSRSLLRENSYRWPAPHLGLPWLSSHRIKNCETQAPFMRSHGRGSTTFTLPSWFGVFFAFLESHNPRVYY